MFRLLLAASAATVMAQELPPSPHPTPPASRREMLDALSDAEVNQAIEKIRQVFLASGVVDDQPLRRAALEGLLARWEPGLELLPGSPADAPPGVAFLAEILDGHIGYVRPGALNASTLGQFDATLADFVAKSVDAVILDLRGVSGGFDFEIAAEFARRLSPKGKVLFTLQRPSAKQERIFTSNRAPAFAGLVAVLVDGRTAAGAEALAEALRQAANAMIVGTDSSGSAVEFEELRLGSGAIFRVAVSQVMLPARGALFPAGVKPDIAVSVPYESLDQIFRESTEKGVSQFVFEPARYRMNEAALVANTNPEIDAAQALQRERNKSPALRDAALVRAVDLITAIQFYQDKPGS